MKLDIRYYIIYIFKYWVKVDGMLSNIEDRLCIFKK